MVGRSARSLVVIGSNAYNLSREQPVRITYFDTGESKFVQEMSMRHRLAEGGSFEYTDPAKRRYVVVVKCCAFGR